MTCRGTTVVHLPLRRRRQPMHRIDCRTAGPQHVGRVQDDAERPGGVGTHLKPRGDRLGMIAAREHLVDGGLLESVQ